nr:hypothetical protein [Rhodovulum sp. P5]
MSLSTKDPAEAKRRFVQAFAAVERHWQALRQDHLTALSFKQCVALAGEIRADFIKIFDEEPGSPETWQRVRLLNKEAQEATQSPFARLMIRPDRDTGNRPALELRFGGFVDTVLGRHGLVIDDESRGKLLQRIAAEMDDAARINFQKARGDYGETGLTKPFPKFQPPEAAEGPQRDAPAKLTFESVISEEVHRRTMGRDAKPLPPNTEKKFRRVAREFAKHRKSDLVETVTAREANDWMRKMQEVGELSNRTIAQRIQNLKTLIEWARGQALGDVFPSGNPLDVLKAPKGAPVPLGERTLRIEEARAILRAARGEAKPELRWLPWLMAYSGARVNEVAQLRADDFFQVGNDWFYRLTTKGGRKLKNQHSARRVPVHPDLIAEGLLAFTGAAKAGERLFPERSQANLRDWVRKSVGLKREALAPNHGWRHLFEDMALTAQMQEAAKRYITGRASRGSDDDYGKSDAMLPALAVEMRKLPPFLEG